MTDVVYVCLDCSEINDSSILSCCDHCQAINLQKYFKYDPSRHESSLSPKFVTKIIVVACSAKKIFPQPQTPALMAYCSSYPQELKDIFHTYSRPPGLEVFILSAKYGLIHENFPICNYDQTMSPHRIQKLKDQVTHSFISILNDNPQIDEIFLLMSSRYYHTIDCERLSQYTKVTRIDASYTGLTERIVSLFHEKFPHWSV